MNILIVNPFFASPSSAGSSRMWYMVKYFSCDHKVTVLTSDLEYRTGSKRQGEFTSDFDCFSNVSIEVVESKIYGKNPLSRAVREMLFANAVKQYVSKHKRELDCMILSSPPLFSMMCVEHCKSVGIKRVIVEVRDPWPDAIFARGIRMPALPKRWLYSVEKRGLTAADACVALTDGIAQMLAHKTNAPIWTVPNMATEIAEVSPSGQHPNPLGIVFAGSIGMGDGFPEYFDFVFRESAKRNDILFNVYGDGPSKQVAETLAANLRTVRFRGTVPKRDIPEIMLRHQIAVMYTRPGLYSRIGLFNKFIDYLAAGLPIVLANSGEGVMPDIIADYNCGVVVSNERPIEMYEAICKLTADDSLREIMGNNALRAAQDLFDPNAVMTTYQNIVTQAIGQPAS